jgi:hypothetical protein
MLWRRRRQENAYEPWSWKVFKITEPSDSLNVSKILPYMVVVVVDGGGSGCLREGLL